jgi:peptide/nickel transport system permease protein
VLACIFGPSFTGYDAYEQRIGERLTAPGSQFLFGSDYLGRDTLTRVLIAGRFSLLVGIGATVTSVAIASVLGIGSAYGPSWFDTVVQRIVDGVQGTPFLVILLLIASTFDMTIPVLILLLGVFSGISGSRVVRGAAFVVKGEAFIEAARSMGSSHLRIAARHMFPNITPLLLVLGSLGMGNAILAEASLSFLGYGVKPPDPTWGQMLGQSARPYMVRAPWLAIAPGLALATVVFSINMLGDALRDTLDPRLRGAR